MLKIRKICDDAFGDISDREKLMNYSKPKLLKLMNILLQYKPDHIKNQSSKRDINLQKKELEEKQAAIEKSSGGKENASENIEEISADISKDSEKDTSTIDENEARNTIESNEANNTDESNESNNATESNEASNTTESSDSGIVENDSNSSTNEDSNENDIEETTANDEMKDDSSNVGAKIIAEKNTTSDSKVNEESKAAASPKLEVPMINEDGVKATTKDESKLDKTETKKNAEEIVKENFEDEIKLNDKSKSSEEKDVNKNESSIPAVKDAKSSQNNSKSNTGNNNYYRRGKNRNNHYTSYDDPNALCGIVFVQSKFTAKIIYHFLKDLSRSDDLYSFLTPQYAITMENEDNVESEIRKQEESLRRFRMKESNLLISNSPLECGIENVKCNLMVAFDVPKTFQQYVYYKVKGKAQQSWFLSFCEEDSVDNYLENLAKHEVLQERLVSLCSSKEPTLEEQEEADLQVNNYPKFTPENSEKPSLTFNNSIQCLNRYCAKLPSDTFTRLTPKWAVRQLDDNSFMCAIQLPINSPLKDIIFGPKMPNVTLAKRAVAFKVCCLLHKEKELDDFMTPVGKDTGKKFVRRYDFDPSGVPRPGTTKRRQYYYKKVAKCLKAKGEEEIEAPDTYYLYSIRLKLNCPIPEEQNTRGRKIYPPEEANQRFGILVKDKIPAICAFPIYTRSGEVMVELASVPVEIKVTPENLTTIRAFHNYTFGQVLRLQKYPMIFNAEASENSMLIIPLVLDNDNEVIDWDFIEKIDKLKNNKLEVLSDETRKNFEFDEKLYEDAVIMPWYRNQDQPQYFYVAEICRHLNPQSDFPGQGFESFEKYYQTKYTINIQNLTQPLLDVDHTSARLNFLTPRYVNRKGVALPTSSEETKRNKRENLEQKQILVPELCSIHPFPASLWRQTVSLPCILYRINGLLLANELREKISMEISLGLNQLPQDFKWKPLTFGWTLADVLKNRDQNAIQNEADKDDKKAEKKSDKNDSGTPKHNDKKKKERNIEKDSSKEGEENEMTDLNDEILSKLNEDEQESKKKKLEIGTWSNEMAENIPEDEDDYLSDEDLEFAELPDNLTIINSKNMSLTPGRGGKDWVSGIEQKAFRVGSPTFFNNPNINIPGLDDELDGLSCSDSDEDFDAMSEVGDDNKKHPQHESIESGNMKIEFRGDNTAEAFEDETEETKRIETLIQEIELEAKMVKDLPWSEDSDESEEENKLKVEFRNDVVKRIEKLKSEQNLFIDADIQFCKTFEKLSISNKTKDPSSSIDELLTVPEVELSDEIKNELSETLNHINQVPPDPNSATIALKNDNESKNDVTSGDSSVEEIKFSFDAQPDLANHSGPSPSLILQALTMSNSNDAINLERLETIGDSFLKYAITTYLFCTHPTIHEGRLSHLRSKQVSNLNLYKLGREKRLGESMIASKFEPHDNWLPPSYHVPFELEQALIESGVPTTYWNLADLPGINEMSGEEIAKYIREKTESLKTEKEPKIKSNEIQNEEGKEKEKEKSVPVEELPSFVPYNLLTQHSIPDKSIADCVESLIGAYLIACGPRGALMFMMWLGIRVLPWVPVKDESKAIENEQNNEQNSNCDKVSVETVVQNEQKILKNDQNSESKVVQDEHSDKQEVKIDDSSEKETLIKETEKIVQKSIAAKTDQTKVAKQVPGILPQPLTPMITISKEALDKLEVLLCGYEKFEETIKYRFNDRSYLLQAFSHASYDKNRLTDCYQRLEFLGDAVLDYLITRHLFEDERQHSPGALTDLRSALVNNTIFASMAVKFQFHKYFKHFSPGLQEVINRFVKNQEDNDFKTAEDYYLIEEEETEDAEDIEVPKALGDIFESVAGAVYLDSGMSLDAVWRVYYYMMKEEINEFSSNVPKSPIRELLELEPETAKFSKPEKLSDGKRVRVCVEVFGKGTFKGIGRNYRIAKCTAAKCALRAIKKREHNNH